MIAILKIVAATLVFAGFLYLIDLARGKAAMAGGMLLTFPAVNGLTLLFAGTPSARVMSETMLPMIAFNGFMCLGFILAFSSLQRSTRFQKRPDVARWTLVVICTGVWIFVALATVPVHRAYQFYFVCSYLVVAAAMIALNFQRERANAIMPARSSPREALARLLNPQTTLRILLFVLTMSAVLLAGALGASGFVGVLGAAPLLPLFGLFALSKSDDSLAALRSLESTVLLGAVVAMAFVMGFSAVADPAHPLFGFLLLLAGWALCLLAIWLVSSVILPRARRVTSRSAR